MGNRKCVKQMICCLTLVWLSIEDDDGVADWGAIGGSCMRRFN